MCQSEYIKQNNFKFRPKKYMCSRNLKKIIILWATGQWKVMTELWTHDLNYKNVHNFINSSFEIESYPNLILP